MDNLVKTFVDHPNAGHTPKFRMQFARKLIDGWLQSPQSPTEVLSFLHIFQQWILTEESTAFKELALEYFNRVSLRNPSVVHEFMSANNLLALFNSSCATSPQERVYVVRFAHLQMTLARDLEPDNHELQRSLANITKVQLHAVLKSQGVHLPLATAIANLYLDHPTALPAENYWTEFSVLVVNLLAGFRLPTVLGVVVGPGTKVMAEFIRDCGEVSRLLPLIWGQANALESVMECLKAFYVIISSEDSYNKPSSALLHVIDKIPPAFLGRATQTLLEDSGQQSGEAKAVVALQNMISWLCAQTTSTAVAPDWVGGVLKALREHERNSILIEVATGAVEPLSKSLLIPDIATSTEDIFFFLLLGVQHTETVFHGIVRHLPILLQELSSEENPSESRVRLLHRLGESAHFFMWRFPDFPDLYNPVLDVLKKLNIGAPTEERVKELRSLSWLSCPILSGAAKLLNSCTSGDGGSFHQPRRLASFLDESVGSRSETGMIGLINLGNTCYMNSVLQALYMTKDFCDGTLHAPISSSQVVLLKLQMTLTYLRYSQRALYSPNEFLKTARPPWFESGRQQDCSEFLRYLLDTLHEQEKQGRGCQGQNTYSEHSVIEAEATPMSTSSDAATPTNLPSSSSASSSPASGDTEDTRVDDDEEGEELEVTTSSTPARTTPNSMANSIPLAKVRTPSNLALDVITEDPEDQQQQVAFSRENEEEKMSQGSVDQGRDADYFGSRGSLDDGDEDDGEAAEMSLAGSRTSLGSAGIKRWTTEENLSMDEGSTEGKMDLLDGPIHDSHSNSTDSGIQSVGDSSIRGSSDSVTNNNNNNAPATTATASSGAAASSPASATSARPDMAPLEIASGSGTPFTSLVQEHFGGKMETSYRCSNCQTVSVHKETFTELHLAIPEQKRPIPKDAPKLTTQTLIGDYLCEERLEDDNQYHCDRCNGLQDAVKTVRVLDGPAHLLCTLMRFKYDRTQNRKSKVFTDIDYELEVSLPTSNIGEEDEEGQKYSLYAIVVHSGYSSDSGHYYTYGREPPSKDEDGNGDVWYIFNDSSVSYSTFESYKNVSKKLPRDTAYQLFYKKAATDQDEQGQRRKRPLRADLKMNVEKDNLNFLREKERSKSKSGFSASPAPSSWMPRRDNDEDDGPGRGCGGGGFNGPSLVF